ncbi:alcohol dehydrogenase catalytic domain-containing protein [Acidianus sp. RZ1]|uniref:alcohol dehydrogenase catalytic domain-containing protein n=1 Tax=Acidianus sp. RZ1 TaxID=1540082 RepID=UPI00149213A1|nr:alcohol dehydrogenase catalytic domain-containing protein [Acidianus sp. RZ1]NON61241.1 alcohol dehydrogenase catalytic domain-containing protein [Acidianus sp. RZ1]
MKAAVFNGIGKPLSFENVQDPEPKDGEVLLKVLGTGLCHGDVHIIMGDWLGDISIKSPLILGHEIVGEVIKGGERVKEGDVVAVYNAFGCGKCKACLKGYPQYCEKVKVLGVEQNGGFAQYVVIPSEENLFKIRGNPLEIVPLADAGVTAYNSVKGIEKGDKVAIIGTGAVSMLGIQILKTRGAEVTVVGRNRIKLNKMSELGADEVVESKGNYITDLSAKTENNKFDYVIDYVGNDQSLMDSMWLLSRLGELRIVGEFGGTLNVHEQLLVLRGLNVRGILYGSKNDMADVISLYYNGKIKTLVVPYSLQEINQAIDDMIEERIIGRAVIIPP